MNYERHIKKTSIRDMFSNRYEPEHIRAFADFYWRTMMLLAILAVLSASVYGAFEMRSVLRDADVLAAEGTTSERRPPLNRAQLQKTLDEFQTRQQSFEFLKTNIPEIGDPSN